MNYYERIVDEPSILRQEQPVEEAMINEVILTHKVPKPEKT